MSFLYAQLPLHRPDKQIRLLRIEPSSSDGDDYRFSLEVHDFYDDIRPSYIAISYTWGDAVPLLPVIVNGKRMRVRFNCWYALWQMRYHGFTDYFWIDSICINQDNDGEKNFQVAIMGSIYESALWVASCLGTGETIGVIQPTLMSDDRDARLARVKLRDRFDQLPYFDRVWIKQEIILARDITLFYGLEKVSWKAFNLLISTEERSLDQALTLDSEESTDIDLFGSSTNSRMSRSLYNEGLESELLRNDSEMNSTTIQLCNHRSKPVLITFVNLVLKYKTAKATNPRDKIYALLSLLPKEDIIHQNLVIDYGQPVFHLFHAIVRLVYYTNSENEEPGQKHMVLDYIRQWLDIDENNPDMDIYLRSIPTSPSDWLPSSTSNLASSWLKECDPEVVLDVIKISKVLPREAKPDNSLNLEPEKYTPLGLLEHINSWKYNGEKWSKADINRLVPIHLEAAKCISTPQNILWEIVPREEEFLVNTDVQSGDLIAMIVWNEDLYENVDSWTAAHAVLRPVNVRDQDQECEDLKNMGAISTGASQYSKKLDSPFILHSWAIPVSKNLTLLTRGVEFFPMARYRALTLGKLRLHHRDALIPLILNNRPLHALMYPSPEDTAFSTIELKSRDESGNDESHMNRVSKRKADVDYIRDVFG